MKMDSLRKVSTFGKEVQAMNYLWDFYWWENAQTSLKISASMEIEQYWSLAEFQNLSLCIIGHLTTDSKISWESFVMEHEQESPRILERVSRRKDAIISVVESRFVHGSANVTLGNYDVNHICKRDIPSFSNVLQIVSADSSFKSTATQLADFSVVFVRGDYYSYYFPKAYCPLLFQIRSRRR